MDSGIAEGRKERNKDIGKRGVVFMFQNERRWRWTMLSGEAAGVDILGWMGMGDQ